MTGNHRQLDDGLPHESKSLTSSAGVCPRSSTGSLPSFEGSNFYFLLLLAFLCLANFISVPLLSASRPGLMVVIPATIAAEVGLVAVFGVFSPLVFTTRFVLTVAMGGVLYLGFCLSVMAVSRGEPEAFLVLLFGLLICPLIFIAVQAPIWGLRIFYDCQRSSPPQATVTDVAASREPIRLSDLLIGTFMVAVSLALAQLATYVIPADESRTEALAAVAVAAIAAVLWSCVSVVLPTWLMLAIRRQRMVAVALVGWTAMGSISVLLTIVPFTFDPSAPLVVMLGISVYVFVLCGGLQLARQLGYRLVRRRETHAESSQPAMTDMPFDSIRDN